MPRYFVSNPAAPLLWIAQGLSNTPPAKVTLVLSWIILDIPRADTSHLHLVYIKKEFIEIV